MLASWVSLLYLILSQPFDSRILVVSEIANEIGITLASYCLLWFTDYVDSPDKEFYFGWSSIGIVLVIVVWNLAIFFIVLVLTLKLYIKRWLVRRA